MDPNVSKYRFVMPKRCFFFVICCWAVPSDVELLYIVTERAIGRPASSWISGCSITTHHANGAGDASYERRLSHCEH